MRRMLSILTLAAAPLAAVPALPETREWTVIPDNPITRVTGAAICPYENPGMGVHNCLSLECVPGEPLLIAASIAGFDEPGDIGLAVDVDGRQIWDLRLTAAGDGRYVKGLSGPAWRAGIEALQAGTSGALTFFTDTYLWHDHLSLKGSREAIDHALASCWQAEIAPARDPDRAARDEVTAYCIDTHSRAAVMNDGFTRQEDFDGDGQMDWVVNYGTANCGPIGSAWCGWAGCEVAIHLARGGGFVQAFRGIAEGFRTVEGGMVFRRHESECAPESEGPCAVFYRFTREGLTRAGEVDWPPL
ncbi:hypothetical protein [uncultured Maritimibacter sp.]|uniref:hypothetical protein n=1 Tax=uncultured Maritimibacter sp. TaxID=991866 RepID=UPI00259ABA81|nr:hypothetical protein [uncultured Maritimibacter sp.]